MEKLEMGALENNSNGRELSFSVQNFLIKLQSFFSK